jgi:signal transduction histidine kinase
VSTELRALLFTPTGRDAELMAAALRDADIDCLHSESWSALERQIREGAGVVVVSEEALTPAAVMRLRMLLGEQPPWSDLPILLLTSRGASAPAIDNASRELGNVTLLERPMRVAALLSAVQASLRARARQYQSRSHLLALERAADDLGLREHELRQEHTRKDEFLATLAHELRNPLAPIRNALHILRSKMDPGLRPLHDILDRQVRHMVRLVDDLLEVSRITRGKVDLRIEQLDLASVLRGAIEISRSLIDAGRHTLIANLPAQPVYVMGDAVRLGQVFANLLNNAAKYTNEGGRISIDVTTTEKEVCVAIADNGVGIAADMLQSIFDMFTQVRDVGARSQGGLGIGLTLARSLIDLHGGRIEADSGGEGQGSCFRVYLLMATAQAVASDVVAPQGAMLPGAGRRLVLVDDNHDAVDTLAMVLRAQGAQVQSVYNASDVLSALTEAEAVVIADLGMPNMDGFELARRIRAQPRYSHIKLVALSGWGQQEDRRRALEAGFDAHLTKPADIDALMAVIRSFDD